MPPRCMPGTLKPKGNEKIVVESVAASVVSKVVKAVQEIFENSSTLESEDFLKCRARRTIYPGRGKSYFQARQNVVICFDAPVALSRDKRILTKEEKKAKKFVKNLIGLALSEVRSRITKDTIRYSNLDVIQEFSCQTTFGKEHIQNFASTTPKLIPITEMESVPNIEWLTVGSFSIDRAFEKINDFIDTWDVDYKWKKVICYCGKKEMEFDTVHQFVVL